jgi:hypothetical protein
MVTCGGPPRLQRRAVELHDSKLVSWEARGTSLVLRLDGYVHSSLGVPGEDQGTGWSQVLELAVSEASVSCEPRELPLWISSGAVEISGRMLLLLPLPLEEAGAVALRFEGAGGTLAVSGAGLTLTALGEAVFVECVARRVS